MSGHVRLPDDETLTREGLDAARCAGRVLILGCGALAREIVAILGAGGLAHVDLRCLPAILHNRPERIVPALREAVAEARAEGYSDIRIAYADCGTGGGLARAASELGLPMIEGPHCYAFFEGTAAFAAREEMTAFYLTDFLVRQFDAFVWEPLGLDRHPELRDVYFGNYETLVYLSQTEDAALLENARDCARRLGLDFEHRRTGYGELADFVAAAARTPVSSTGS